MKSIVDFKNKKEQKQKISMITCYDFSFAQLVSQTNIDCILVGDSAAMTMHGYDTTLNIDTHVMALHIAAVKKGAPQKFIIGDMPFLSFRKSLNQNMSAVETLMKAGSQAIKLEGADGNIKLVHHIVQSGVPVMGHLGLTPQSIHQLGGFKVQGKEEQVANKIIEQAQKLQDAGCFSIVLECVPSKLAKKITDELHIPTIGIGAGVDCDGQVLVLQDMLGMNPNFNPKFVKKYLDGANLIKNAVNDFHDEVVAKKFPTAKESYS